MIATEGISGVLERYHLHNTAKVTAEHHVLVGREANLQNLVSPGEEDWNKWYASNHRRSWVMVEFGEHKRFEGIGFKNAGDRPKLNPTRVKISVYHELTGGWTEIGERDLHWGPLKKWHTINFPELHGQTKSVLFNFDNNHGPDEIQLGEIIFYKPKG